MADLEDVRQNMELLRGFVDADGASSNFTAIQNQVIVLTTYLQMKGAPMKLDAPDARYL